MYMVRQTGTIRKRRCGVKTNYIFGDGEKKQLSFNCKQSNPTLFKYPMTYAYMDDLLYAFVYIVCVPQREIARNNSKYYYILFSFAYAINFIIIQTNVT